MIFLSTVALLNNHDVALWEECLHGIGFISRSHRLFSFGETIVNF